MPMSCHSLAPRSTARVLSRSFVVACVALGLIGLAGIAAPRADAAVAHVDYSAHFDQLGARWPGTRITYWVGDSNLAPLAVEAVAGWNRSGARIRFVRISDRRAAQVRVIVDDSCGAGCANLGYRRGTKSTVRISRLLMQEATKFGDRGGTVFAIRHEFGHVLGLGHPFVGGEPRACSVMSGGSHSNWEKCGDRPVWKVGSGAVWAHRYRPLYAFDVRSVVKMYGGRAVVPAFTPLKPTEPAPVVTSVRPGDYWGPDDVIRRVWYVDYANQYDFRTVKMAITLSPSGSCLQYPWQAGVASNVDGHRQKLPDVPPGDYCLNIWSYRYPSMRFALNSPFFEYFSRPLNMPVTITAPPAA